MKDNNGVKVSFREIFDATQEVANEVQEVNTRLQVLEKEMRQFAKTKERSISAAHTAEEAKEKIQEIQEEQRRLKHTVIGAVITGTMAALAGSLYYFF